MPNAAPHIYDGGKWEGRCTYGGAANGMPKNWVIPPDTLPWNAPYWSLTTGASCGADWELGIKDAKEAPTKKTVERSANRNIGKKLADLGKPSTSLCTSYRRDSFVKSSNDISFEL